MSVYIGDSTLYVYLHGYHNNFIPFHYKKVGLWRFNITDSIVKYLGLHVKSPVFFAPF
jgi:hypothetical protein